MARRWIDCTFAENCGIHTNVHSKELQSAESYFQELYYHNLIHGQQWARGFQPIIGACFHTSKPVIFYAGRRLPIDFTFRPDNIIDLVLAVYWMMFLDCYLVDLSRESLFWDPINKQVLLSDYQLYNPNHPEFYQVVVSTHDTVIELKKSPQPVDDLIRKKLYKATFETLIGALEPHVVWDVWREVRELDRPTIRPAPIALPDFIQEMTNIHGTMFQEGTIHQKDSLSIIQTPPLECNDGETPFYPFIGKMFNPDYMEAHYEGNDNPLTVELRGSHMADLFDPEGRYHARLVKECMHMSYPQLIYEYTGKSLNKLELDTPIAREWFYFGLSNLMDGLMLFHRNNFIHGDVKPGNITRDLFYNLKLIDFGISSVAEVPNISIEITDQWNYIAHPVELMLVVDSSVDAELLKLAHLNSFRMTAKRGVYDLFTSVVQTVDFDNYKKQLLELDERERVVRITKGTDIYGLGISLLLILPMDSITELRSVLYHLLAIDLNDRSLELAKSKLNELLNR